MTLSRTKNVRAPARSGAEFWLVTIVLAVILIGVLTVLARIVGVV